MEPAELDQGSDEDGEHGVSILGAVPEVKIPRETPEAHWFQDLGPRRGGNRDLSPL